MRSGTSQLNAEMNVTPFLDVLLVLIIAFMAAMTARKTMDAQLPVTCAASDCASDGDAITLEVLADGSFRLNHTPVSATALLTTLRSVYDGRPNKIIQVVGHRDAHYQSVIAAMDVARSAGVKVIALPPSESSALVQQHP